MSLRVCARAACARSDSELVACDMLLMQYVRTYLYTLAIWYTRVTGGLGTVGHTYSDRAPYRDRLTVSTHNSADQITSTYHVRVSRTCTLTGVRGPYSTQ